MGVKRWNSLTQKENNCLRRSLYFIEAVHVSSFFLNEKRNFVPKLFFKRKWKTKTNKQSPLFLWIDTSFSRKIKENKLKKMRKYCFATVHILLLDAIDVPFIFSAVLLCLRQRQVMSSICETRSISAVWILIGKEQHSFCFHSTYRVNLNLCFSINNTFCVLK